MLAGTLQVLHLKNYNNKDSEENPLADFRKAINPFAPMTCARHVYIFLSEEDCVSKELMTFLSEHTSFCEYLKGQEAYYFLLSWAVGAQSKKLKGNDHFVLHEIRKPWTEFCKAQEAPKELTQLMSMLFEDARNIRNLIQLSDTDSAMIQDTLKDVCKKCTNEREKGNKPLYDVLLEDNLEAVREAQRKFFEKRVVCISRGISSLNVRAADGLLSPSDFKNQAKTPLVSMFRRNIELAEEKKKIIGPLTTVAHEKHKPHHRTSA